MGQLKYDANGLRVGKSDSTGSVRYLSDPLTHEILATYDAGTGLRLWQFNANPQKLGEVFSAKTAQGTQLYPMTDMLGSIYAVADPTGTPQATFSYDVYGAQTVVSGNPGYPFAFTGLELDHDTGLIYAQQRYYDPTVGSWLSKDRIGFKAGPNLYEYVWDRPTLLRDPTGQIAGVDDVTVLGLILLAAIIVVLTDLIIRDSGALTGAGTTTLSSPAFCPLPTYASKGDPQSQRPRNAPTGTVPIDEMPDLDTDQSHAMGLSPA